MEAAANDLLAEIDALGGPLAAIEAGFQQRQIQESAYRAQRAIEDGTAVVVGLNRYVDAHQAGSGPPLQRIDAAAEARQVAGVRRVRAERDPEQWRRAIEDLDAAARRDVNLMPPMIAAVAARATLGEISDVLRRAWGEHRELLTI